MGKVDRIRRRSVTKMFGASLDPELLTQPVLKAGTLEKSSGGKKGEKGLPSAKQNWQSRHVVLWGGETPTLAYFRSAADFEKASPPKGVVSLRHVVGGVETKASGDGTFHFTICTVDRNLTVRSGDEAEVAAWVEAVLGAAQQTVDRAEMGLLEQAAEESSEGSAKPTLDAKTMGVQASKKLVSSSVHGLSAAVGLTATAASTGRKTMLGKHVDLRLLSGDVVKAGSLTKSSGGKKAGNKRQNWQLRYFVVLRGPQPAIVYYGSQQDHVLGKSPKGALSLESVEQPAEPAQTVAGTFQFAIKSADRDLLLQADTLEEAASWLSTVVDAAKVVTASAQSEAAPVVEPETVAHEPSAYTSRHVARKGPEFEAELDRVFADLFPYSFTYVCVRRSQIRAGVGYDSESIGFLEAGQEVEPADRKEIKAPGDVKTVLRLQLDLSAVPFTEDTSAADKRRRNLERAQKQNEKLRQAEEKRLLEESLRVAPDTVPRGENAGLWFIVVKACGCRKGFDPGSSDKVKNDIGTVIQLQERERFECLEQRFNEKTGTMRVRLWLVGHTRNKLGPCEAWVSVKSKAGETLLMGIQPPAAPPLATIATDELEDAEPESGWKTGWISEHSKDGKFTLLEKKHYGDSGPEDLAEGLGNMQEPGQYIIAANEVVQELAETLEDLQLCWPPQTATTAYFLKQYHLRMARRIGAFLAAAERFEAGVIHMIVNWLLWYHYVLSDVGGDDAWPKLLDLPCVDAIMVQYRQCVCATLDSWSNNLLAIEEKSEPEANEDGLCFTNSPIDLFQMLNQQVQLSEDMGEARFVYSAFNGCLDGLLHFQSLQTQHLTESGKQANPRYLCAVINNSSHTIELIEDLKERVVSVLPQAFAQQMDCGEVISGFIGVTHSSKEQLVGQIFVKLESDLSLFFAKEWYEEKVKMVAITAPLIDGLLELQPKITEHFFRKLTVDTIKNLVMLYVRALVTTKHKLTSQTSLIVAADVATIQAAFLNGSIVGVVKEKTLRKELIVVHAVDELLKVQPDEFCDTFEKIMSQFPKFLTLEDGDHILDKRTDMDSSERKRRRKELTAVITKRTLAAVMVQTRLRGVMQRKRAAKAAHAHHADAAAAAIQAAWRGTKTRNDLSRAKLKTADDAARTEAAIHIQAVNRGHRIRAEASKQRESARASIELQNEQLQLAPDQVLFSGWLAKRSGGKTDQAGLAMIQATMGSNRAVDDAKKVASSMRKGRRMSVGELVQKWDRRFFVLTPVELQYFKDKAAADSGADPSGSIALAGSTVSPNLDRATLTFYIGTSKRIYSLRAEDDDTYDVFLQQLATATAWCETLVARGLTATGRKSEEEGDSPTRAQPKKMEVECNADDEDGALE